MLKTGWETCDGIHNKSFNSDPARYSRAAEQLNKPLPKTFILKCFLWISLVNNATLSTQPSVSSAGSSSHPVPTGSAWQPRICIQAPPGPRFHLHLQDLPAKPQFGLLLGHPSPFSYCRCSVQSVTVLLSQLCLVSHLQAEITQHPDQSSTFSRSTSLQCQGHSS